VVLVVLVDLEVLVRRAKDLQEGIRARMRPHIAVLVAVAQVQSEQMVTQELAWAALALLTSAATMAAAVVAATLVQVDRLVELVAAVQVGTLSHLQAQQVRTTWAAAAAVREHLLQPEILPAASAALVLLSSVIREL
jgi:hypothetical protein